MITLNFIVSDLYTDTCNLWEIFLRFSISWGCFIRLCFFDYSKYGLTKVRIWYSLVEVKACYGMSRKVSSSSPAFNLSLSTLYVEPLLKYRIIPIFEYSLQYSMGLHMIYAIPRNTNPWNLASLLNLLEHQLLTKGLRLLNLFWNYQEHGFLL
jgi:hypothetical protein